MIPMQVGGKGAPFQGGKGGPFQGGKGGGGKGKGGKGGGGKGGGSKGKGAFGGEQGAQVFYRDSFVENPWRNLLPNDPLALPMTPAPPGSLAPAAGVSGQSGAKRSDGDVSASVGPPPGPPPCAATQQAGLVSLEELRYASSELSALLEGVTDEELAGELMPHIRALCELAARPRAPTMDPASYSYQPVAAAALEDSPEMGLPPKRSRMSLPPPRQEPADALTSAALLEAIGSGSG